jgi:hypothetical protein
MSGFIFIIVGFTVWFGYLALLIRSLNKDPKDKYGGHI